MTKGDKAVELFKSGLNCSQSVFCAFAEDFGIDLETAKRISCGLGGGVGRMREVCGTVTGAALVLGLKYGNGDKAVTYPYVQDFCERFKRDNGSIVCKELLAGRVEVGGAPAPRTPEYYRKRPCVELCRYVADMLEMDFRIDYCATVLNQGGVAVIPTDTVYGLAAKPDFPAAVERLYTLKHRDERKPIAMLVSNSSMLTGKAKELADKYWPGALTIVTQGEGYRMPDDEVTLRLIDKCGGRLRVTSANISGSAPLPSAVGADNLGADYVLDAGPAKVGVASTVIKVDEASASSPVTVLREGPIKL